MESKKFFPVIFAIIALVAAGFQAGCSSYNAYEFPKVVVEDPVYNIQDVDTQPRATAANEPLAAPREITQKYGTQHQVVTEYTVGKDGNVRDVVTKSYTDRRWAGSVSEAISKWHFEPATKGGNPVSCRLQTTASWPGSN